MQLAENIDEAKGKPEPLVQCRYIGRVFTDQIEYRTLGDPSQLRPGKGLNGSVTVLREPLAALVNECDMYRAISPPATT